MGGAIGATARYLVTGWGQKAFGTEFPWGTAIVNIAGCFLIGLLMTLAIEVSPMRPELRLFLVTGILGGLTTFSTFGWETIRFVQEGELLVALSNLGLNLVVGLAATLAGTWVARSL
ncbi:MAG: fluoride efflux transporter CrcB [Chitinophagales bacterium]